MIARSDARTDARRELVLAATILVALGGIVEAPVAAAVALLAAVAVGAGTLAVVGDGTPRGAPPEALAVPVVLAAGTVGALRVVPAGLPWVPALVLFALGLAWALRLELRLATSMSGGTDGARSQVLAIVLATAFVAFTGVAALVPGGLVEPGGAPLDLVPSGGASLEGLSEDRLLALVVGDALVALALGFRMSALRYGAQRDVAWSAATYALVVALAAGAVRAIDLPRLAGPAVLTLVLYLWDAIHAAGPTRRREARFLWETALLVALAIVVVAWNVQLRA